MNLSDLQDYADLLEIRHKAARRNSILSGAIFILTLGAFLTLGMLGRLTALEIYLTAAMLVVFGLAFISALIKLDCVSALREICRYLL